MPALLLNTRAADPQAVQSNDDDEMMYAVPPPLAPRGPLPPTTPQTSPWRRRRGIAWLASSDGSDAENGDAAGSSPSPLSSHSPPNGRSDSRSSPSSGGSFHSVSLLGSAPRGLVHPESASREEDQRFHDQIISLKSSLLVKAERKLQSLMDSALERHGETHADIRPPSIRARFCVDTRAALQELYIEDLFSIIVGDAASVQVLTLRDPDGIEETERVGLSVLMRREYTAPLTLTILPDSPWASPTNSHSRSPNSALDTGRFRFTSAERRGDQTDPAYASSDGSGIQGWRS